ncbi:MAG: exopolysaccharide biosynthesis protein [Devosia sp.]|nr:exopolysaccharide biosynthesis protein [Devosia sp.]
MTELDLDETQGGEKREAPDFRLSTLLADIAAGNEDDRVSIGDLLAALNQRALGAMIFIFAVPVALPLPPGVSTIFGAPLLFLTAQLMLGLKPWLPKLITNRSLTRREFGKIVTTVTPWLLRAESVMKPRLSFVGGPPFVYLLGFACLIESIILFLPIPLGNMLPALAVSIMSLGLLARDGLWMLIGLLTGILAVVIVWGVLWAMLFAALFVVGNVFGVTF